ncbi:S1 family peptidase [Lentzea nigeriaca]|uniref:S1 family peptidase n=1 Tax=Lentzea nigeriaca TaxID=1128665 RepID=UPI00195D5BEC|nr:S1 family peptidase [Lentzea nigeriaca]MBM7856496.1 hypothetical protein [Lentzea nigeriaca]
MIAAGSMAAAVFGAGQPAAASTDVTGDRPATSTVVEVFTTPPATPDQYADDVAQALETAEARAEADPADLAPPYVDSATGRIVAGVRAEADSTKVAYAAAGIAVNASNDDDGNDDPTQGGVESGKTEEPAASATKSEQVVIIPRMFYPSTPKAKYSLADLDAVKDAVLESDVPGVQNMYAASVDAERNRVVVRTSALTEETRTALAGRFGADKVAVHLTPGADLGAEYSRDDDANPFFGGATTNTSAYTCTIGFSWTHEGASYFLTAGHCTGANTDVRMPRYGSQKVGKVVKDNWNNNTGSVKLSGQSYYSGDLSLVKMNGSWKTAGKMYVGGENSSTHRVVKGVASRSPKVGDKYCTGGTTRGELCGWKVSDVKANVRYRTGHLARNVNLGKKGGTCTAPGDSGGPIYTVSNGKIVAKGIHSGGGRDGSCLEVFTDVRLAEKALPGIVKKG